MGKPVSRGAARFRRWCRRESMPVAAVSRAIGDSGGQVSQWASGARPRLPLGLVVALAEHTGEPFAAFATTDQMRTARVLSALLARDAGAA